MAAMTLRPAHVVLTLLLLILQVFLWVGDSGFTQYEHVKKQIEAQQADNSIMHDRNAALSTAVVTLQREDNSYREIEGLAREELGMIRKGETFFYIPD